MNQITFENHRMKCRCCFQPLSNRKISLAKYKHLLESVIESKLKIDTQSADFLCTTCVTILEEYEKFQKKTKKLQNLYNDFLGRDEIVIKTEPTDADYNFFPMAPQQEIERIDILDGEIILNNIKSEFIDIKPCIVKLERYNTASMLTSSINPSRQHQNKRVPVPNARTYRSRQFNWKKFVS